MNVDEARPVFHRGAPVYGVLRQIIPSSSEAQEHVWSFFVIDRTREMSNVTPILQSLFTLPTAYGASRPALKMGMGLTPPIIFKELSRVLYGTYDAVPFIEL